MAVDLGKLHEEMRAAQRDDDVALYEDLKLVYQDEIDKLEPNHIGPTWEKDALGRWMLPKLTIGWAVIEWCYEYLNSPAGGNTRLVLTDEQLRFLLWWYAVDENGRFAYRAGVLQRLKGWGKDPTAAILASVEFVGPSQFAGWDADGQPLAKAHPNAWVQVAAVSLEQTKNTALMFPVIMSDHLIKSYGISITPAAQVIRADFGRKRIEMVTSNFRTIEGGRPTFTILNEPHHWIAGNGGIEMYRAVQRNATKTRGRYLAITNAFLPGEGSVAEQMREAYEAVDAGLAKDTRVLYDSIEAHPDTPLTEEALEVVIPKIRGDATWLDVPGIIDAIQDLSIPPSMSRRMWLNQVVAGEDALHTPKHWDSMARNGETLYPGDEIVLGFDGGKSDDATALIAMRVSDMFVWPLGIWQKPDHYTEGKWEVNRDAVESVVHETFRTYKVKGMYCDVRLWESYIAEWQRAYGETVAVKASDPRPFEWDMSGAKRATLAHHRLLSAIQERKLRHPGKSTQLATLMRMHVLNARRHENIHGLSFTKESRESPKKVDAYAALMLAHECLLDYRQRGQEKRERSGRGWIF